MTDVEGRHLRAAPPARRGDGKAHLVVDIHERQRPGGVRAGTRHVSAAWPQRRVVIADTAPRLERQPRLMHLLENVVHRVADRAGHGAIDGRGRRLMLPGTGIGGHTAGGNRAVAQGPDETLVPALAHLFALHVGQRAGDTLIGVVHRAIERLALLGRQPILLVPDVQGCFLERDGGEVSMHGFHDGIHGDSDPLILVLFSAFVGPVRPESATTSYCGRGPETNCALRSPSRLWNTSSHPLIEHKINHLSTYIDYWQCLNLCRCGAAPT